MRGTSSRKNSPKRIVYTAVFFVMIIGVGMLLPRLFGLVSGVVLAPMNAVSGWYQTSEQLVPVVLRDRVALLTQIENLESALEIAKSQGVTTRRLQDENNRLRNLLGVTTEERIAATVVARPAELPYDLLQIDQGSIAGIKEGALVYVDSDQLIGLVSYVGIDYSLVKLFTSPGAELTGYIAGPDVIATVEGVGGGVARVRVPQGIPLSVGNLVYVPSVQPGLFGRIDFVENRPSQPEQFGYITLAFPLQSLHTVAVTDVPVAPATPESVFSGQDFIISSLLLAEEANTVSFEDLLSTSTPTTTEEVTDEDSL